MNRHTILAASLFATVTFAGCQWFKPEPVPEPVPPVATEPAAPVVEPVEAPAPEVAKTDCPPVEAAPAPVKAKVKKHWKKHKKASKPADTAKTTTEYITVESMANIDSLKKQIGDLKALVAEKNKYAIEQESKVAGLKQQVKSIGDELAACNEARMSWLEMQDKCVKTDDSMIDRSPRK